MNKPKDFKGPDRRQYKRISKNFILSYFFKDKPTEKIEITQLKNISMGGMCFITSKHFMPSTLLGIELKTPYISEITYLEGEVLESQEKIKNMIYETRLQFTSLNENAKFLLTKLIEYFLSEES